MAYDAFAPKDDEEAKKEAEPSPYESLLASPGGAGVATPAVQPAHKTATRGFVNTDRVVNANKSAIDSTRMNVASGQQAALQRLQSGLNTTGSGIQTAATAHTTTGPSDTTVVADIQDPTKTAVQNIDGLTYVSKADAEKGAGAKYDGPKQSEVDSKYGALLQQYQDAKNAPGLNAFDARLVRPGASALDGFDAAYKKSYDGATGAVSDAGKTTDKAASAWNALLTKYTGQMTDATTKANEKKDDEEGTRWDAGLNAVFANNGAAAPADYLTGKRPTGAQLADALRSGPNVFGFTANKLSQVMRPEAFKAMEGIFDKMTDTEIRNFMSLDPNRDLQGWVKALQGYANLHGMRFE